MKPAVLDRVGSSLVPALGGLYQPSSEFRGRELANVQAVSLQKYMLVNPPGLKLAFEMWEGVSTAQANFGGLGLGYFGNDITDTQPAGRLKTRMVVSPKAATKGAGKATGALCSIGSTVATGKRAIVYHQSIKEQNAFSGRLLEGGIPPTQNRDDSGLISRIHRPVEPSTSKPAISRRLIFHWPDNS